MWNKPWWNIFILSKVKAKKTSGNCMMIHNSCHSHCMGGVHHRSSVNSSDATGIFWPEKGNTLFLAQGKQWRRDWGSRKIEMLSKPTAVCYLAQPITGLASPSNRVVWPCISSQGPLWWKLSFLAIVKLSYWHCMIDPPSLTVTHISSGTVRVKIVWLPLYMNSDLCRKALEQFIFSAANLFFFMV